MRGKQSVFDSPVLSIRITPARAGKTSSWSGSRTSISDHPRACGENDNQRIHPVSVCGSPPRVRGKPVVELRELAAVRITPARAGKTTRRSCWSTAIKDHPRACGENAIVARPNRLRTGSPPRVRGKHEHREGRRIRRGITPARAGKTTQRAINCRHGTDHPRACGENVMPSIGSSAVAGSPPRVRGKPSRREASA